MHEKEITILKQTIRNIPDFPVKGVLFRDITPVLLNRETFRLAISVLCARYLDKKIDAVAGIEARGFIFGSAVARELNTGFIPIRKKGKLPHATVSASYDLEYGSATVEMHVDAVKPGDRILLVDDLLATGGTAAASADMITKLGGQIEEIEFLIELDALQGREKLTNYPVYSVIHF